MQGNLYNTIFSLLKSSLWGEEKYQFTAGTDTDWESVYRELCAQTVQNLPTELLIRENPEQRRQYIIQSTKNVSNWHKLMGEQQSLCQLLWEKEIPFAILKGAAVDCYYPQPLYRNMGDIDIIVKPEDFDTVYHMMLENGYTLLGEELQRHVEFAKNGVVLELHRYFGVFNSEEYAKRLNERIYVALDRTEIVTMESYSFSVLPKLENGLVLLGHINQHLEEGLGLRQIIDWMLFVDKELRDGFWETEFKACAREVGMEPLAITVTRMCQLYLGLTEDIKWCSTGDKGLCEELMNYIIVHGNFGRKMSKSNSVIKTVRAMRNIPYFFKKLQQYGCSNWAALKRFHWLKPFAWLYQMFRYINRGLHREQPFKQLREDVAMEREYRVLLERLGVRQQVKEKTSWK